MFARLCAQRERCYINDIVMLLKAALSDGQGSHEDKLLEPIYLKPVVNDTWE